MPTDLTIHQIRAHDGVRITRGPNHVVADHFHYTADDQTVVLEADPGGVVEVTREGKPVPITGRVVTWNLADDTFNINEPAGTTIPLKR